MFEMRKCFLIAAAAIMLVGCEKQEQSEFSSNDLKNEALPQGTVVGTVKYDAGAYKDSKGVIFEENFVPAKGQQVKIEVSNADYIAGSAGDQIFLADVDENGKFSYTLPLGLAATNVRVSVIPFYAEKKVYSAGAIVSIPDALYSNGVGPIVKALTNKDVKTYDFNVTSDATVTEKMSKSVTVNGRILVQQWVKNGGDYDVKNVANENRWDITCKVSTWDDNGDPYMDYTKTGIKTNADGEFSFTINLPDNWKDMTFMPMLKISTTPVLDNSFVGRYYVIADTQWKSQTCSVLYPSVNKTLNVTVNNDVVPLNYGDIVIYPELQDKTGLKGIGNPAVDLDDMMTLLYNQGALNTTWYW